MDFRVCGFALKSSVLQNIYETIQEATATYQSLLDSMKGYILTLQLSAGLKSTVKTYRILLGNYNKTFE